MCCEWKRMNVLNGGEGECAVSGGEGKCAVSGGEGECVVSGRGV